MFYAYLTRFEKVLTQFSKRHAYGVRKITEINLSSHLVACVRNRAQLESARSTLCRPHLKQTITPVSSMMPSDSHCNQTLFRYRTLEDYRWHAVLSDAVGISRPSGLPLILIASLLKVEDSRSQYQFMILLHGTTVPSEWPLSNEIYFPSSASVNNRKQTVK